MNKINIKNITKQIEESLSNLADKFSLLTLLTILGILAAFTTTLWFLNRQPKAVKAGWWPKIGLHWQSRKQLTIQNNSSQNLAQKTTVSITVNTEKLYNSGKLKKDCEDIRIIYSPNTNIHKELPIYLSYPDKLECYNSHSTKIYFPLQSDLISEDNDSNYYLYFQNPSAVPQNTPLHAFNFGTHDSSLVCLFNGSSNCINNVTPTNQVGALRFHSEMGSSLNFSKDNEVSIPNISEMTTGSGTFTAEGWFNINNSSDGVLMGKIGYNQGITINGTTIGCRLWDGNTTSYGVNSSINYNQWHHIACQYDQSTGRITLYIDGDYKGENFFSGTVRNNGTTLYLFRKRVSNSGVYGLAEGIRLSTNIRYTDNFIPPLHPLTIDEHTKLLFHFDESGEDPRYPGKVIDASGNNNHGIISGAIHTSGLAGVDSEHALIGGHLGSNSFASNQGFLLEEGTTNLIKNPSFEHNIYNKGWSNQNSLAISKNTLSPFLKFGTNSTKIISSSDNNNIFDTSITPANSHIHTFSAYLYNGTTENIGGEINDSIAKLSFNKEPLNTTYINSGGGWWRLVASINIPEIDKYDSSNINSDQGLFTTNENQYLSQGFQVSENVPIDRIILFLKRIGPSSSTTTSHHRIEIHTDDNGLPSGNIITNGSSACVRRNSSTNYQQIEFRFSNRPLLDANMQYHIVLKPYTNSTCSVLQASPDSTNYLAWGFDDNGNYTSGDRSAYSNLSESWTTNTNEDHSFIIYSVKEFDFGLIVKSGKTIYTDGFQLETNDLIGGYESPNRSFATTYIDGSLGNGYSWSGEPNNSSSSRIGGNGGKIEYSPDYLNPSEGTVSFWLKRLYINTTPGGWGYRSGYFTTHSSSGIHFDQDLLVTTSSTGLICPTWGSGTGVNLEINRWYHIVITWNSDEGYKRCYINANESFEKESPDELNPSTVKIGQGSNWGAIYPSDGIISDLRIFNSALSQSEIINLYHSNLVVYTKETALNRPESKLLDPIAHWKLNENSGEILYDSSIYEHHATLASGDAAPSRKDEKNCIFGKCLSFDGNNNYAISPKIPIGINTIGFWIKPLHENGYVLQLNSESYVKIENSNLITSGLEAPIIYVNGAISDKIEIHQWQYVTIATESIINANNFLIGRVDENYFHGLLDIIVLYNYVRSEDQIKTDYNLGFAAIFGHQTETAPTTPLSEKLIAHWKFDEGYGNTTYDQIDNNHGAISGASWTNDGKFGKALNFDGSSDYVSTNFYPGDSTLGQQFTWTFWKKYNLFASNTGSSGNSVTNPRFYTQIENDSGALRAAFGDAFWTTTTLGAESIGKWLHISFVFDQGTVYTFVNGELKHTRENVSFTGDSSSPLSMGRGFQNARFHNGIIDEVKIYNYALTDEEIRQDYNQGASVVMGSVGTDSDGNPSFASSTAYCIPGDDSYCAPPVAEWKFDEKQGTTAYDTSGNGNDGTLVNNPTWQSAAHCQQGSCLKFNGNDQYASTTMSKTLEATTFSFWMNWEGLGSTAINFISEGESQNKMMIHTGGGSGTNGLRFSFASSNSLLDTTNIISPGWNHYTFTYNNGLVKLFKNGNLENSNIVTNETVTITSLDIGRRSVSNNYHFNGLIDQIKIYDYARTPAQIAHDYNRGAPVGHWKFDECQGTTAYDVSGNENHGTINIGGSGSQTSAGTCTSGNSAHAWYNGRDGKINSSLNFDGTDDYVEIGDIDEVEEIGEISVSAWIKPSTVTSASIVDKWQTGTNSFILWRATSTSSLKFRVYNQSSSNAEADSQTDLSVGNWMHVTGTWDGSTVKIYINGKQKGTTGSLSGIINDGSASLNFGYGNSDYFDGLIDDVRIYNYALTGLQIKNLYNQGAAVRFSQ